MNMKTNLANKGNYGGTRNTSAIKYIVVHYTGNDGDTDENNGNYFKNNVVEASAHYFVDDDSITQTVPDDYVAWHCGAKTYKHANCRNTNSLGVEICDDVKNGTIYPSEKTIANALELVEYLMKKYSVPKENVIRHYDVTGKLCPAYWCGTAEKDAKWLTAFWNRLGTSNGSVSTNTAKEEKPSSATSGDVLYRVQVGAYSNKANAEAQLKKLTAAGFSGFIVTGEKTAEPVKPTNKIKAGSVVMVKGNATDYNGGSLASFVYERKHMVKSISGDRAVIVYNGIVVAAVHKDDLFLVE